ncbi:MAG: pyridoxal phosphate-dependent aminotransferase [Holdemanella sp.]|nr:pyridoxal phosphate-dependent aminotransferase [Holdemanella sp.]
MSIRDKMIPQFERIEGGLRTTVSKADVGEGTGNFMKNGGDNMAWADMFYPDPSIPESVMKATLEAIQSGFTSHYTMPIGMLELREEIAKHVNKRTGLSIDPSRNVVVTPGSDSGLMFAMMPFISQKDEILIPDPCYPSNYLNGTLLGGVSIPVPTYPEDNYQIRMEEMEKRVTPRTKMVLLTHPNNPTTTVYRKENLIELSKFIIKHDLVLVCDQAFEDHIFDGIEYVAPCTLEGMWERTVTVCSLSKGYGLSGYRIGYVYACEDIMDAMYGTCVNICGAPCTSSTFGAIAALKDETILPAYYEKLDKRRTMAYEILSSAPGVKMNKSESGILSWLDISALGTSAEVVAYIRDHANILVNEGTPYGKMGKGHIRIVTACFYDDEQSRIRLERIRDALTQMAKERGIV